MKTKQIFLISLTIILAFLNQKLEAQSENHNLFQKVELKSGEVLYGYLIESTGEHIVLDTENEEREIVRANIVSITYDDLKNDFNFKNIHKTHYFLNSSAVPLPKGGAYVSLTNLTILSVNYGLTKRWSVGGGFDFLSANTSYPSWFLNPRFGIRLKPKIHFSTGLLLGKMTDFFDAGLLYGKFTLGQEDSNLSLGLGTGYLNGEYFGGAHGSLAFSHTFNSRLRGRRWGITSENYYFPNYNLPFEGSLDNLFMGVHGVKIYLKKASLGLGIITFPKIYQHGITRMYISFNISF